MVEVKGSACHDTADDLPQSSIMMMDVSTTRSPLALTAFVLEAPLLLPQTDLIIPDAKMFIRCGPSGPLAALGHSISLISRDALLENT